MTTRLLKFLAATTLAALSILYMSASLWESRVALSDVGRGARLDLIIAGVVVHSLSLTLGCRVWWSILHRVSPTAISARDHWRIFALTNPTRYVPGRVLHVASLGVMLRSAGVPPAATLTSLFTHMWLSNLASIIIGVVFVLATHASLAMQVTIAAIGVAMVSVGTHPRPIRWVLAHAGRLSGERALDWRGSWTTALGYVAADVGAHLLSGFACWMLIAATLGVSIAEAPRVMAANTVASLAGYLSLVPAGLGVREATMTVLLGTASVSAPALAAVIVRVGTTVADVLLALIALLMTRRQVRRPLPERRAGSGQS